jgi:hypothetical protein
LVVEDCGVALRVELRIGQNNYTKVPRRLRLQNRLIRRRWVARGRTS